MNLSITCSSKFNNVNFIRDFIYKIKKEMGPRVVVQSPMCSNGDKLIKKYCLESGVLYQEYNPSYSGHNLYSAMPTEYYGKHFHPTHDIHRLELMTRSTDKLLFLGPKDKTAKLLEKLVKKYKKSIFYMD